MDCAQTQNLIHAFVDGELDLVRNLEIELHLQDCSACEQAHESLRTLRIGLASSSLYHKAPAGLRDRLKAAGRESEKSVAKRLRIPVRGLGFVTAAAAAVVLAFGMGRFVFPQSPSVSDRLAQEIVSSHVRSLMMNHLADIESTNQHTVKPWFVDKVTYSLPVKKLSDEGFPLAGGRVDFIDGQRVAALVYHREKHVINLFVWPADNQLDRAPQFETRHDYQLIHWIQAEKNFWAISDLNKEELGEFAELIRKP